MDAVIGIATLVAAVLEWRRELAAIRNPRRGRGSARANHRR